VQETAAVQGKWQAYHPEGWLVAGGIEGGDFNPVEEVLVCCVRPYFLALGGWQRKPQP
jgi:hypothetical protein